jgi:hypothetical protein
MIDVFYVDGLLEAYIGRRHKLRQALAIRACTHVSRHVRAELAHHIPAAETEVVALRKI